MIIAAPDLAFYECLCERLLHPPSTMTAIAGTPSWNDPLSMAFLFSSPAASFMLSSSDSRHDRPRAFSVATKDFLVITGTSSTTSSQRVVRDLHWSTSAPRRLPGCTPTADPPPPQGRSPWKRWGMQPPCDSCYRWRWGQMPNPPNSAHRSGRWSRSDKNESGRRPAPQTSAAGPCSLSYIHL